MNSSVFLNCVWVGWASADISMNLSLRIFICNFEVTFLPIIGPKEEIGLSYSLMSSSLSVSVSLSE